MKKKYIKNGIIIAILIVIGYSILSIKKYDFIIAKEGNFNINNPIIIKIESKYYGKDKSLGTINVNLFNKHNNDEKMVTDIQPYQDNRYELVFVPKVPGKYYLNITYQPMNEEKIIINQEFEVK